MVQKWENRKLGELAKIVTGKIDANRAVKDGSYPFYTCADEVLRINETAFEGESILVAGNGDFWVKYHPSGKFNAYQRTYVIKNLSKQTATRYLYFAVSTQTPKFKKMAQGGIIKFLHLGQLQSLKIPLPPLAIQRQIVERLDKIAEAQKLNGGLIQKTDELFQSLLHKELNPVGKNWEENKFINCIDKNPLKIKGIPREKYQTSGKFPIIDQSDKFIVGYTDDENKVYKIGFPIIIFGDHTRIFKYIDFDFAIGADGTQIVIPDRKVFIPKFFYFLMLNLRVGNLGYSRHFKILKTKRLIIPPLNIQKQIVAKLSAVQDYKKQLLGQKSKLKELFDSALAKSMSNQ